ncbi:uncharacterized protein LAESUDRAFT_725040 [Laetiporus sulphureus 93-53]|uniref:F-box domain-containing protein n=1 Tax=Laetiporus sulphureus 93-53 TaxID=1314785 RepID=A0A165EIT1_9APHY|nr:uncharacterized protein LAESUDRAFT_725040 [Laetiporus sulphureus 93-53]KZT07137.1 hypothetical protein LAESUDRAFT_725040 [Laetiporus sulphureus 93-53]
MPLELAVELWDNVLEHHSDDRPTLLVCSLVCQDWLQIARKHLFHTICLEDNVLECFSQLSFDILYHIRRLTVRTCLPRDALFQTCLPRSLLHAQRLHELSITFLDVTTRDLVSTLPFSPQLRESISLGAEFAFIRLISLRSLAIDGLDLPRILCSCPRLSTLRLEGIKWKYNYDNNTPFPPELASIKPSRCVEITELTLVDHTPNISLWLLHGPFKLKLHTLEIEWDEETADNNDKIIRACSSLQRLVLRMSRLSRFKERLPLPIVQMPNLRLFHLKQIPLFDSRLMLSRGNIITMILQAVMNHPLFDLQMDVGRRRPGRCFCLSMARCRRRPCASG